MPKKRKINTRTINKNIYIFCEGRKTEPQYFSEMIRNLKFPFELATVKCIDSPHTDLLGLVDAAVTHRKSIGTTHDVYWVVVDKNGYTKHPEGFSKAAAKKIHIAFSSICFEFWLFLHFEDRAPPKLKCRGVIDDLLKKHIPSYEKAAENIFSITKAALKTATARAISLRKRVLPLKDNIYNINPYTDVDILTTSLYKYRKELSDKYPGK
jgi:hypothetical protein